MTFLSSNCVIIISTETKVMFVRVCVSLLVRFSICSITGEVVDVSCYFLEEWNVTEEPSKRILVKFKIKIQIKQGVKIFPC